MDMTSQALQNAKSIEEVVELINGGGTSNNDGNEIAGQYAFDGANESKDNGLNKEDFEAQLDCLIEAGAIFDYPQALLEAIKNKKNNES